MLAARVGAAGDVDADAADLGQPRLLQRLADLGGQAPGLGDGQVAGVGAGAAHHVAGQLGSRRRHVDGLEPLVQAGQLVLLQAAEHEVLAVGDPHLDPELALDRRHLAELGGGDVTQAAPSVGRHRALGRAAHHVGLVPAPVAVGAAEHHVHALPDRGQRGGGGRAGRLVAVLLHVVGDAAGPRGGRQQQLALLEDAGAQLVDAHGVDQPLHAGPQLVVAVAVVVERAQDRLQGGQQLLAGRELLQRLGRVGVGAQATGHEDPEAGLHAAVGTGPVDGDDADVVEHGLAAVGDAAREVDLELAGQALGVRVAEEVAEGGLGPGADVEHLERAGAGQVAADDVADGVAARLPGGEPDRVELAHHVGDPLEVDEVELDVLPGGDVAPPTRVRVGDVGQHLQLLGRDRAVGQLDPDHLVVAALALAVDAVVQAEDAETVLVEVAGQVQRQHLLELRDVGQGGGADRIRGPPRRRCSGS